LNAGDYILDFAGVTAPGGLQDIGALVQRSEMVSMCSELLADSQTPLRLVVSRGSEAQRVVLTLTPRSGWGGRGLLGCHILPA
jgi:26S proteasome non-ATPase regulatory subunit 9